MLGIYMTKKYLKAYRIALVINFFLIVGFGTFLAKSNTFGEVLNITLGALFLSFFLMWMPTLIYSLFLEVIHPKEKEKQVNELIDKIVSDSKGQYE